MNYIGDEHSKALALEQKLRQYKRERIWHQPLRIEVSDDELVTLIRSVDQRRTHLLQILNESGS